MCPREPVHIRRNIESYGDPYLRDLKPGESAVCRECKCVFSGGRWELKDKSGNTATRSHTIETLCPACQKIRDHVPGGVVTLSGSFLVNHVDEILRLIERENERAMEINPLERIMDIDRSTEGTIVVLTTNEKLAQRIGKALHKAYSGKVEYKWSEDTKLARVKWHRD